jgi:DNA-binding MarR family transcriptional regulator
MFAQIESAASAQALGGVLDERRSSPGLLLALVGHVAMRRLRDTHTAHNLTPRQFHLLALLHDHGDTGQRELGTSMGTDPSILVTMLNPLESDGLISRERDPDDRRRHLVSLTAAGERHLIRAAQAQREAEDTLFAGLDDDQREQLRELLICLQDSLTGGSGMPCSLTTTGEPSCSSPGQATGAGGSIGHATGADAS